MMLTNRLSCLYTMVVIVLLCSVSGCSKNQKKLNVPANVKIEVDGRWMTVFWDAAKNASGYLIYTASTGCGSGNRIADTKTQAFTNHAGTTLTSTYPTNGSVEFLSPTSIRIWLMPASGSQTVPMASAVSAKVMALGGDNKYTDSDYSNETTLNKADYK